MAVNIAELIIVSLIVSWIFLKLRLPALIGMLLVGIVLGPYMLGVMNPVVMQVSSDLRMVALVVILLRAGFGLSRKTLKKVGRSVLVMSVIPPLAEALTITWVAPLFLPIGYLEAAILGCILSAVSPAVVVDHMIGLIERRRGTAKGIPTLILASSTLSNVIAIVAYGVLIGWYAGTSTSALMKLAGVPIGFIIGISVGLLAGWILYQIFERYNPRATKRVLVLLAVSILLIEAEAWLTDVVPFTALLSIMLMAYVILERREHMAHELSAKLAKLWILAEIILFTLVGAEVNLTVAWQAGLSGLAIISLGLVIRSLVGWVCLSYSGLESREKAFIIVSNIPKATVQAAIGAGPLITMKAMGAPTYAGELILAVSFLSILLTAPIGAISISYASSRWLSKDADEYPASLQAISESGGHREELI